MKKRSTPADIWIALLYLGLGIMSAKLWLYITTYGLQFIPYLQQLNVPLKQDAFLDNWHRSMITGNAPAPNQYRILTPWLVQYLILPLNVTSSMYSAYAVIRGLCIGLTLFCFDRYLRTWFTRSAAAAGTLCLAALIPVTYYAVIQESDPLNLLVIVLACWALTQKRDGWLFPLVLVGTLNRETTLMIPALYFLARWKEAPTQHVLLRTALLTLCWAAVFGGLHAAYGPRANYTEPIMLQQNFSNFQHTLTAFLFLSVLWILPWLAPKDTPLLLRRGLWLVPPFVVLHYIVAVVQEVRLFLPLAPILVPLSWWVLFPEARQQPVTATPAKAGTRRGG